MTMIHPPVLVPVSRLSLAPQNVRKSYSGEADAQLKASIAARGVLQNLVGLPVPRRRGHFSIIAGGRRLRAVEALVAEGVLSDNYALPVLPLPDGSHVVEVSLDENFQKLGMLGHVSGVSSDGGGGTLPCLLRAARSAYPKSWRRAAWNKHLRAVERRRRRRTVRQHACHAGVVEGDGALQRAAHLTTGQNLSS